MEILQLIKDAIKVYRKLASRFKVKRKLVGKNACKLVFVIYKFVYFYFFKLGQLIPSALPTKDNLRR
jgi:hypothetical protein